MTDTSQLPTPAVRLLPQNQVYAMATTSLIIGLFAGYVLHSPGNEKPATTPTKAVVTQPAQQAQPHLLSLDEVKKLESEKTPPLLEKLKQDPNNVAILSQIAANYYASHQFKDALVYYDRAAKAEPKNVNVHVKYAACLYRVKQIDPAIAQLNQALAVDPNNVDALYDIGIMKVMGKKDALGALAAWKQLLKSNPNLPADRKKVVENLIGQIESAAQHPMPGAGSPTLQKPAQPNQK